MRIVCSSYAKSHFWVLSESFRLLSSVYKREHLSPEIIMTVDQHKQNSTIFYRLWHYKVTANSLIFFFYFVMFYLHVMSVPHAYLVPMKTRRVVRFPGTGDTKGCEQRVQEMKPWTFVRKNRWS